MFLNNQDEKEKDKYFDLLKIVGSLSNLFADTNVPYLYYRAAENIFCKSFEADNLSRSDCSADARKNKMGIGLKTFLNNNGKTFQKVAEFNKDRAEYLDKDSKELILKISDMRNKRIESTKIIHDVDSMLYHCVAREENKFIIFEEKMDIITIDKIARIKKNGNTITFDDEIHEYSFNMSKSTLFKRFLTPEKSLYLDVEIIKDPFELLENLFKNGNNLLDFSNNNNNEFIILPLYSSKSKRVEERSALNQWNANGRKRDEDEVYIPVPTEIHKKYPNFFPPVNISFNLILPNKKIISAKMCQTLIIDGVNKGKGLMSNPNKELGKWLLRDILKIKQGELVTNEHLNDLGIDSVEIRKIDNNNYAIDFKSIGSYEDFISEEKFLNQ